MRAIAARGVLGVKALWQSARSLPRAVMSDDGSRDGGGNNAHGHGNLSSDDWRKDDATMELEAYTQLSEGDRHTFALLMRRVHDEARGGGPRTVYSMLAALKDMSTDQMEACIKLYNNAQSDVIVAKDDFSLSPRHPVEKAPPPGDVSRNSWEAGEIVVAQATKIAIDSAAEESVCPQRRRLAQCLATPGSRPKVPFIMNSVRGPAMTITAGACGQTI